MAKAQEFLGPGAQLGSTTNPMAMRPEGWERGVVVPPSCALAAPHFSAPKFWL
ncbi:MAG: hypothetical protein JWQ04_1168 [Pedosphaera sp.]|nr:hypothetical protein [Pedosphaera sp.]